MFKHHMLGLAVLLCLPFTTAQAQETSKTTFPKVNNERLEGPAQKPHIGVTLGTMNPDNSYKSAFEYGIDAGFQPMLPIGFGLEVSAVSTDRSEGDRTQNLNRTSILPRVTYNLAGDIPVVRNSYLGLGAGAIFDAKSPNQGTHFGLAPLAGFDIPLVNEPRRNFVSLGLGAKYLFVSGPSPDSFSVNGLVKYWF